MKRTLLFSALLFTLATLRSSCTPADNQVLTSYPSVYTESVSEAFPLAADGQCAEICLSDEDFAVVNITADMLADDVERVTGMVLVGRRCPIAQGRALYSARSLYTAGTISAVSWYLHQR